MIMKNPTFCEVKWINTMRLDNCFYKASW